jgi:hypothetical protein
MLQTVAWRVVERVIPLVVLVAHSPLAAPIAVRAVAAALRLSWQAFLLLLLAVVVAVVRPIKTVRQELPDRRALRELALVLWPLVMWAARAIKVVRLLAVVWVVLRRQAAQVV